MFLPIMQRHACRYCVCHNALSLANATCIVKFHFALNGTAINACAQQAGEKQCSALRNIDAYLLSTQRYEY